VMLEGEARSLDADLDPPLSAPAPLADTAP
jgi:hypothetical protein